MRLSFAPLFLRQDALLPKGLGIDGKKPLETTTKPRKYTIDLLRAIGAFSVITLHMPYVGLSQGTVDSILLSGRWAVPFFFLASGYFFEISSQGNLDKEFIKTLKHLINLFVVTNAIYFFIALRTEFYSLGDILSIRTLVLGDYFHLWFIGALIFAYLLLWFILSARLTWLMPLVVLFGLAFCLLADPYSAFAPINLDGFLPRFLLSVPFLFLGFLCSRYHLPEKAGFIPLILLVLGGAFLQVAERSYLPHFGTAPRNSHEFFLGTFIFSIGLFILAAKIKLNKANALTEIGRQYSLFIYLYHPLLIVFIYYLIKNLAWQDKSCLLWFNPLSIFLASLAAVKLLNSNAPKLFQILNGRF